MMEQIQAVAIIAAGGVGSRMGASCPKQFLPLAGHPLIWHTLFNLAKVSCIKRLVLVLRAEDMKFCQELILKGSLDKPIDLIEGGQERSDSVYAGLQATLPTEEIVLVHDAVRPFIRPQLVKRVVEKASTVMAAIAAVPVKETIKRVEDGIIAETPVRAQLWRAQTPQAFKRSLLFDAYAAWDVQKMATDEAMMVEMLGQAVHIVEGDEANIKITTQEDLIWSEWFMQARKTDI